MTFVHLVAIVKFSNIAIAYQHSINNDETIVVPKRKFTKKMKQAPMQIPYNFQVVPTAGASYQDLVDYDPYFEQFTPYEDLDEFYKIAVEHSVLTIVDVAAFLERQYSLNAFQLQKILYYIYADYLTQYHAEPFKAKFQVYQYGPVNTKVYQLNKYEPKKFKTNFDFEQKIYGIANGQELLKFIHAEVVKYQEKFRSMSDPNPTHQANTPWSVAQAENGRQAVISKENIIKNHRYEMI